MGEYLHSYRLGLHVTDAWSIDISDEVEQLEPFGTPPAPLSLLQEVTLGAYAGYGGYWAYPYKSSAILFMTEAIGNTTGGTRIMLACAPAAVGVQMIFEFLVPVKSIELNGKVFTKELYPDSVWQTPAGYPYFTVTAPVGISDTEHPFYQLRHYTVDEFGSTPAPAGTDWEFTNTLA